MEPQIQYAKTSDGVSIAYWTFGEGMPLIFIPSTFMSATHSGWRTAQVRRWYEGLARAWKLIRYDPRGAGLSQRDVGERSLDTRILDLQAVVAALELEQVSVFASGSAGPSAISYAARHWQQVSRLFLWCTYARAPVIRPRIEAIANLAEVDLELASQTMARDILGWETAESTAEMASYVKENFTAENMKAAFMEASTLDATDVLSEVRSKVLVMQRQGAPEWGLENARMLASEIKLARLIMVDAATSNVPFAGEIEPILKAMEDFASEDAAQSDAKAPSLPEGTAIILFADIASSTALTEQLGDAAFRTKSRELDTALRAAITEAGGTPIEGKVMGDGVMATFPSARQAITGAVRCSNLGDESGLPLHLGIHAGDVIREEDNVYGGAVNIAARIADAAPPGDVLVSDTVRGLARTSVEAGFEDRGEYELQGVADPQRLYAVRWQAQE